MRYLHQSFFNYIRHVLVTTPLIYSNFGPNSAKLLLRITFTADS